MLIVSNNLSDEPNDKKRASSCSGAAKENGFTFTEALFDTGYYSEANANVEGFQARSVEPYIAVEKQSHSIEPEKILGETTETDSNTEVDSIKVAKLPKDASAKAQMERKTEKALKRPNCIRRVMQIVEPVFGIIKHYMRFRHFLVRGKENVSGEWNLVCAAHNLKRTFNLI